MNTVNWYELLAALLQGLVPILLSALYQITKFPVSEHMSENLRLYRAV